jgi:hypothetical protein
LRHCLLRARRGSPARTHGAGGRRLHARIERCPVFLSSGQRFHEVVPHDLQILPELREGLRLVQRRDGRLQEDMLALGDLAESSARLRRRSDVRESLKTDVRLDRFE